MARAKTSDVIHAFVGNLEKSYDEAGVLHVRGLATDATLDLDGQRCDPEWLKSAMPKWMEWGNVREMHGSNAVGTAVDMEQKGAGWIVEAAVIDPLAAKKVESGVYKGFSIGIKGYGLDKSVQALEMAPNGIINSGEIIEISLVDRPANPNAKIEVAKFVEGELVKVDAEKGVPAEIAAEVRSESGTICVTCGGFGEVKNEGGVTEGMHECPDCHGSGESQGDGGVNIRPSDAAGDQDNGEVADNLDDERGKEAELDKAALSAKKINDLPDSDFAYIEPGGAKDSEGKTAPRSKRHFPIQDAAHVRNALAGAPQSPFGAKAMPKIKAAAKKFDIEVSKALELVDGFITKAAEPEWKHDPAVLAETRDGLIQLATQELAEFSAGDDERDDVWQLVSALNTFLSWWQGEAAEGEVPEPFTQGDDDMFAGLGVSPDLIKAVSADDATDEVRAEFRTEVVKALGLDEIATVVTQNQELVKSVQTLTDELAKVKEMAAPRGIALRATQEQKAKAGQRETLLSEAKSLRASASLFSEPGTRSEFIQKAVELEKQADAIKIESED